MHEITAPGLKQGLIIENPVMPAAGVFGFDSPYRRLIDVSLLGAVVTNPLTLQPRRAARGTRVAPLASGALVHTGLPNPGLSRAIRDYASAWARSPAPVIVHVAATGPDDVAACARQLDGLENVGAIEVGLPDQASYREARLTIEAAVRATQLPIIARLPLGDALVLAPAASEGGAASLTVGAPPRGVARDPISGRLIGGRLYGPWVKNLALRAVGQVAGRRLLPVIGGGGIHSPQDARDFLEAGAVAVQVDAVIWVQPTMLAKIARDLGGLERTRVAGDWLDEYRA